MRDQVDHPVELQVGIRALARPIDAKKKRGRKAAATASGSVGGVGSLFLAFDTETDTGEHHQRLTIGSYVLGRRTAGDGPEIIDQGMFYHDSLALLDPAGFDTVRSFADDEGYRFMSRTDYVRTVLLRYCADGEGTVVGFNLPFDLSRIATGWHRPSKRRFIGGFGLELGPSAGGNVPSSVLVKKIDQKKAFIEFSGAGSRRKGRFVDVRTLFFALTSRAPDLRTVAEELGVARKQEAAGFGEITARFCEYAMQDAVVTAEAYCRLCARLESLNIGLDASKAFSPASVFKAAEQAMGVTSPMQRFSSLPDTYYGWAMGSFYGGRSECMISGVPMPVAVCDFKSMYPSIRALMGLWDFDLAANVRAVDVTDEARALLDSVSCDDVFRSEFWPALRIFAQVIPDGDRLPTRAPYSQGSGYTIGDNYLIGTAEMCGRDYPMWFTMADLMASKIRTGKSAKIVRAFTLECHGQVPTTPIEFGSVRLDPARDLAVQMIEQRVAVQRREQEAKHAGRLDEASALANDSLALKITANAGYGVSAQFNRQTLPASKSERAQVFGRFAEPWEAEIAHPEVAGEYCFPPVAAWITAGARLMLAALEVQVAGLGGSHVDCDTDSMAIVATAHGGLIPCKSGLVQREDGTDCVRALTIEEVGAITDRFQLLWPYRCDEAETQRRASLAGMARWADEARMLKLEKLHTCLAISPKRYVLFDYAEDGSALIVEAREHGIGWLQNPRFDPTLRFDEETAEEDIWEEIAPKGGWRRGYESRYIRTNYVNWLWRYVLKTVAGIPFPAGSTLPDWFDRLAVSQFTATTPDLLGRYETKDAAAYDESPKPFNFAMTAKLERHRTEAPSVWAPYERDAAKWSGAEWRPFRSPTSEPARWDLDSKFEVVCPEDYDEQPPYEIVGATLFGRTIRSYMDSFARNRDGSTFGVGRSHRTRRTVHIAGVVHMGKEGEDEDDVLAGIKEVDETFLFFPDGSPTVDLRLVLALISDVPAGILGEALGVTDQYVRMIRKGTKKPSRAAYERLLALAWQHIKGDGAPAPADWQAAFCELAVYEAEAVCEQCSRALAGKQRKFCGRRCEREARNAARRVAGEFCWSESDEEFPVPTGELITHSTPFQPGKRLRARKPATELPATVILVDGEDGWHWFCKACDGRGFAAYHGDREAVARSARRHAEKRCQGHAVFLVHGFERINERGPLCQARVRQFACE